MEAQYGREDAGHEQDVQDVGEGAAEPWLGESEQQPRALLLCGGHDAGGSGGDGEGPGAEGEEDGDEADGEEHHARDHDVRAAGLLGVHGCLLEAGERRYAEAQRGGDARAGEGVGVERVQRQALLRRVGDGGDVEDDDERDLDEQQDAEHTRVEVDLQPAEGADQQDGGERGDPPADGDVGVLVEQPGHLEAEDAEQAHLEHAVGHERDDGGGRARGAAEAARDVGVEGTGVVDVPAHLRVAEAEQGEDDAEYQEQQGLAHHAHHAVRRRHDARDDHQRPGGGEHGQEQARGAEAARAQGPLLAHVRTDAAALPRDGPAAGSRAAAGAACAGARTARRHGAVVLSARRGPLVMRLVCRVVRATCGWRVARAGWCGVAVVRSRGGAMVRVRPCRVPCRGRRSRPGADRGRGRTRGPRSRAGRCGGRGPRTRPPGPRRTGRGRGS